MHEEKKSPAFEAALCTARWTSDTPRAAIDAALKAATDAGGDPAAAKVLREVIDAVSPSQWRASHRHVWASLARRGAGRSLTGRGNRWTLRVEELRADGARYAPSRSACPLELTSPDPETEELRLSYGGAGAPPPAEAALLDVAREALEAAPLSVASRLWGETIWPAILRKIGGTVTSMGSGSVVVVEGAGAVATLREISKILKALGQRTVDVARCPMAEVAAPAAEGLASELDALARDAEAALADERTVQARTIEAAELLIAGAEKRLAAYEAALGERLDRLRDSRAQAEKKWAKLRSSTKSPARAKAERAVRKLGGSIPATATDEQAAEWAELAAQNLEFLTALSEESMTLQGEAAFGLLPIIATLETLGLVAIIENTDGSISVAEKE